MQKFVGTGVALVTPFKTDQSVDFESLIKLVNFNIDNGVDYLVINGTTGESATITSEEKLKIIEVIVTANNGRLPLVLVLEVITLLVLFMNWQQEILPISMRFYLLRPTIVSQHRRDFISILKPSQKRHQFQLFYTMFLEELQKTCLLKQL